MNRTSMLMHSMDTERGIEALMRTFGAHLPLPLVPLEESLSHLALSSKGPSPLHTQWAKMREIQAASPTARVAFPFLIRIDSIEIEIRQKVADMAFSGAIYHARLYNQDTAIVFAFGQDEKAGEDFDLIKYLRGPPLVMNEQARILVYRLEPDVTINKVLTDLTLARMRLSEKIPDRDGSFVLHLNQGNGYRLQQLLGRGSDGVVYLARSLNPGNPAKYAIKLHVTKEADLSYNQEKVAYQIIASVDPNDPRKLIESSDAHHVLVMTFIEGKRLYETMAESPEIRDLYTAAYLDLGPAFLAKFGLKHNDIRPNNVMVHPKRGLMLIDFSNTIAFPSLRPGSKAWTEILRDETEYAAQELEFYKIEIAASKALQRPGHPESRYAAQTYYDVLVERGSDTHAEDYASDAAQLGLHLRTVLRSRSHPLYKLPF